MSHGPTNIDTKGACLYCRRTDVTLTDEHIIPLFIGGKHVIKKASCSACADITKKFEQDVARELWGDARISYNAPSRRKKKKPTHIMLPGRIPGEHPLLVPYHEYPAPMIFYGMNRAGILRSVAADIDVSKEWVLKYIFDNDKAKRFEAKYPGRLTAKFRHVPESFGRLLAKIGYGQVLCTLDLSDFDPICLPYILGTKRNVSYIVGGRESLAPSTPGIGYSMSTFLVADMTMAILGAEIRLLGDNGSPTYHAVVGSVAGAERVQKVKNKVRATYMVELNSEFAPSKQLPDDLHWMPKIWPIKHDYIEANAADKANNRVVASR